MLYVGMGLPLHPQLLSVWDRCRVFVEETCKGRGPSHGLAHMEQVATDALMLYSMCPSEEQTGSIWQGTTGMVRSPSRDLSTKTTNDCLLRDTADATELEWRPSPSLSALTMHRIILAGMLHDVADHKYDDEKGSLKGKVQAFARGECERLFDLVKRGAEEEEAQQGGFPNTVATSSHEDEISPTHPSILALFSLEDRAEFFPSTEERHVVVERELQQLFLTITAISFSTEKKWGKNWFVDAMKCSEVLQAAEGWPPSSVVNWLCPLRPSWCLVRHVVSDADKLLALGEEGLVRCYAYTCEVTAEKHKTEASSLAPFTADVSACQALERKLLQDVEAHFHEKLSILATEYMHTTPGRCRSGIKVQEMIETLHKWKANGPPSVALYWR